MTGATGRPSGSRGTGPLDAHVPAPIVGRAERTDPVHEALLADSVGAAQPFVEELHRRGLAFSIGFPMTPAVKQAILTSRPPRLAARVRPGPA